MYNRYDKIKKRLFHVYVHKEIWQKENGKIPEDCIVIHKNGNKQDNRIENLELVKRLDIKRLKQGCFYKDGQIHKTCRRCGFSAIISPDFWYFKEKGWIAFGACKKCVNAYHTEHNRKTRLARKKQKIVKQGKNKAKNA